MDLKLNVARLPPSETVLTSSVTYTPGGKRGKLNSSGRRVRKDSWSATTLPLGNWRAHLLTNGVGLEGTVNVPGPSGTAVIS